MINRVTIQPHPLDRVSIVLSPLFLITKPTINANTNKITNNSITLIYLMSVGNESTTCLKGL